MALHWRPVGPEPASTYWQRRAVVATAAVLLLALLVSLFGGDGGEDRLSGAPGPSPAPVAATPVATPTVSPLPSAAAAPICQPDALKVEALAGGESFRTGATPRLSLRVTNTGTTPCTRDLGQAAVELLVFSGKDRIWSSDDCAPGGAKAVTTLAPGKGEVQRVTWNGRRSLPGCEGDKAKAQAGTYRVHGRVGQLRVEGEVFRLTG
jgi:hypothetical protein